MTIDRELLWKAWPRGFVPMKGISTIGGFICTDVDADGFSSWVSTLDHTGVGWRADANLQEWSLRQDDGTYVPDWRFLPVVDPMETSTWACLLHELAAARCEDPPDLPVIRKDGDSWFLFFIVEAYGGGQEADAVWLETSENKGDAATQDPALALVQARTELRRKNR